MEEMKWNERFNLGVEAIDRAHQRLFVLLNKLIALSENDVKQPQLCKEGIRHFIKCALKHFMEEEEYMCQIAYDNYGSHKLLHDSMRDKVFPELEKELEEENYSGESVQRFIGICIGWLNAHIIVEDHAIVYKAPEHWVHNPYGDEVASLEKAVVQAFWKMFRIKAEILTSHYSGENFYPGNKLCYRLSYRGRRRASLQVLFVFEDRQMLKEIGEIMGRPLKKVDRTVLYAVKVLSEKFVEDVRKHFPSTDSFRLEKSENISFDRFVRTFDIEYPVYSMLFETEDVGQFAFCVRKNVKAERDGSLAR